MIYVIFRVCGKSLKRLAVVELPESDDHQGALEEWAINSDHNKVNHCIFAVISADHKICAFKFDWDMTIAVPLPFFGFEEVAA